MSENKPGVDDPGARGSVSPTRVASGAQQPLDAPHPSVMPMAASPVAPQVAEAPSDQLPVEIAELTDDGVKQLAAALKHVLDTATTRIHYAETRRNTIAVMGSALIAVSIALLSIVIDKVKVHALQVGLLVLCVSLAGVGVLVLVIYARQTNFSYPFNPATKAWKWFYRDALGDARKEIIGSTWYAGTSKEDAAKRQAAFVNERPTFEAKQIPGLADAKMSAYQDVQQAYILHVNEGYKNHFLSQLRRVYNRGLVVALALAVATIAGVSILDVQRPKSALIEAVATVDGIVTTARWRATGAETSAGGETLSQWLFNAHVANGTKLPVAVRAFELRDDAGLLVPPVLAASAGRPRTLPAGAAFDTAFFQWLPKHVGTRLAAVRGVR